MAVLVLLVDTSSGGTEGGGEGEIEREWVERKEGRKREEEKKEAGDTVKREKG